MFAKLVCTKKFKNTKEGKYAIIYQNHTFFQGVFGKYFWIFFFMFDQSKYFENIFSMKTSFFKMQKKTFVIKVEKTSSINDISRSLSLLGQDHKSHLLTIHPRHTLTITSHPIPPTQYFARLGALKKIFFYLFIKY